MNPAATQVDKMIVCVCNNVSDREIVQAFELGVTNMADLKANLGVATCCGSCHDCAQQILQDTQEAHTAALV